MVTSVNSRWLAALARSFTRFSTPIIPGVENLVKRQRMIFDTTNVQTYPDVYMKLCEVFHQVRREGGRTPRIAFKVNTQAVLPGPPRVAEQRKQPCGDQAQCSGTHRRPRPSPSPP